MKRSFALIILLTICLFMADRVTALILNSAEERIFIGHRLGKVNYFLKVKDSMKILIFGSSRASHHVDPSLFDKPTYNIGMGATHVGYASALISTLSKKDQIILVQIDYKTMFSQEYYGNDALELLYKSSKNNGIYNFFNKNFRNELMLSKISKSYVFNGVVPGIIKNYTLYGDLAPTNNGYEPLIPNENQKRIFKEMLEQNRVKILETSQPIKINERYKQFILQIKEIAAKNNDLLVFFTSPSLVKIDNQLIEMISIFLEKEGLVYLNHTKILNGENIELWKDHTHLSEKGASLYSKKLAGSLLTITNEKGQQE